MKTNLKASIKDFAHRLAGGMGMPSAIVSPEDALRRAVMANLLWEDNAYQDGKLIADEIIRLVPQVAPEVVYEIAYNARHEQKLRHVPLLLAREMARHDSHRRLVGRLLNAIILRPDELTEFVSLYWADGKKPLAKQVKKGLAQAFTKFDAYQLAKYNRKSVIKLRDVMFLVHPKPKDSTQAQTFKQLANNTLPTPDTWEVALSTATPDTDKKELWTRLISQGRLGALAYLRNLRNMEQAGVEHGLILQGLAQLNTKMLLPINYISAVRHAPRYADVLGEMMAQSLADLPKLAGRTVFVVDVSGSMQAGISGRSRMTRLDCAVAMAILATGLCEDVVLYATAGSDYRSVHETKQIKGVPQGFALEKEIKRMEKTLGGGGIFTRQCLEYIHDDLQAQAKISGETYNEPTRLIVFSDSQDCDRNHKLPKPFAKYNYIIDVSAHTRGVNYQGVWTAEISGWSEHFLRYIASLEGVSVGADGE